MAVPNTPGDYGGTLMSMGRRRAWSWFEQDAFSPWRDVLVYMQRAGTVRKAKRQANKRDRRQARQELRKP